ncbi:TetR/AcrR family transcriptional regulator [Micrococcus cohnii]|uniref:AcrR family transcriptional regulator n=1 Tax=Micrococcus cohnii TaxID=993416 RepID=A0A7W7GPG7_9MICC|nr:TetR/AcrR family transcriptional regulator [Micrococcus cohnii]MBB4735906.1 AcrR family transcriptional regulator [Micrococcus cohnii]
MNMTTREEAERTEPVAGAAGDAVSQRAEAAPKRRGRPRSQASREAILRATGELMAPGQYAQLTMEGIAARAGVSKQTVYRWWPSKADVIVESVGEGYLTLPLPGPEDTGDLHADLRVWMHLLRHEIEGGGASQLAQGLVGALAQQDSRGETIRAVLVDPVAEQVGSRLEAASQSLGTALDVEKIIEVFTSLILMNVLFGQRMSDEWIDETIAWLIPRA